MKNIYHSATSFNVPDDAQWEAITSCNPVLDSIVWYGVSSTGIFCRPSCRSKTPLREGTRLFYSTEAAKEAGFRACKRCQPELTVYEPVRDLAEQAKAVCDKHWDDDAALREALGALPVANRHLVRIFKEAFGKTPTGYVAGLRIHQAKAMLKGTQSDAFVSLDLRDVRHLQSGKTHPSVTEVAHFCGFGSMTAFYGHFRDEVGLSPLEWLKSENNPL